MKQIRIKDKVILDDFIKYYEAHPEFRFFQAIRNWLGVNFLLTSTHYNQEMFNKEWLEKNKVETEDTFYM